MAYNYGLGAPERVRDGVVYGTAYTVAMMALCAAVLWGFAGPIAGVFQVSEEVRMLCTRALQVIPLGYLFAGANISFQGIFQALGKGGYSLLVSLLRLVVVALPLCWLFTCLPAPGTYRLVCLSSGGGGGPDCCGAAFENVLQGKGAPPEIGEGIGALSTGAAPL